MNILLLSPKYPPSQGGVEVQMELLANELVKRGNKVVVITSCEIGAPTIEFPNGVRVFRYPMPNSQVDYWNGYKFIKNNLDTILKLIALEHIDVIHVHQFEMSVSFVHQLKMVTDIPIVVTVHTSVSINEWYLKMCGITRRMVRVLPIQYMERQSLLEADWVIGVSEEISKYCSKKCNGKQAISTILPAINLDAFQSDISIQTHTNLILCPGRISQEKGQIVLIEALGIVRNAGVNAKVLFIGSGKESDVLVLEQRINTLGLNDYISFLPPQPYDTISNWYKMADLIVIPSLSESFGLSALENMALGNVVIASNVGGLKKLIEHNKNGLLFECGDAIDLADKIQIAFREPERMRSIRVEAIRTSKRYDIVTATDRIENIYRGLVS